MIEALAEIGLQPLALIWAAVIFASLLRAFTGFGFALAAVPVFSLFLPPTDAVVLSSSLILAISLKNRRTYWGVVPLRPMLPLVGMAIIGTALGAALLSLVSPQLFRLWAGLSVILVCICMTFFRPSSLDKSSQLTGSTGLVCGLMNGVLAMPGPPIIIFTMLTEPDPVRSRAMLMTLLLGAAVIALLSYAVAGFFSLQSLWYFLCGLPAMWLGDKLGNYLFRKYGDAFYRRIALAALLVVGATITLSAFG